ncbi:ribonuclease HII [Alkalihalobacterium alkalinitrilicum]|uniref:ribonuclease HII n=1 Tax=Alkalihalobacterium alkalinitrilicum TaxID=427920 RepID=UPI000995400B|nr:ribonuclease HII [Alkalihalobacterium alkalinitrilicum]
MNQFTIKQVEQLLFNNETELSDELFSSIKIDERKGVQKLVERYEKQRQKEMQLKEMFIGMSRYETNLRNEGVEWIAGVDEVGRGPLAGPVVCCAVILPKDFYLPGLTDSKKLSKEKRDAFYVTILQEAVAVETSIISAAVIDKINIYEATKMGMTEAINGLKIQPEHVLIDAMKLAISIPQTSIVKGDATSITIAASSVVAKVTRDRYMEQLGARYPLYGFERHMGYGTKEHLHAINTYGIIDREHRMSFSPVKESISS